jgi:hypothetical protein
MSSANLQAAADANPTIQIIECTADFVLTDDVLRSDKPILLRNLVAHWPLVIKAKVSTEDAVQYLMQFYSGIDVIEVQGGAELKGRIAYSNDFTKLNCVSFKKPLTQVFEDIFAAAKQEEPPLYYMGTTSVNALLPGFSEANHLDLAQQKASAFMWLGNRSCISTHYDLPDNIACNVVGRRRFTLFPPNQLANLYVGPLDFTPAGQAIGLVDVRSPDYERFPKFREAQRAALIANLEPGDALFLPSMWWHNVEGLDDLNILVNYWWRQSPAYMGSPADVLELALLAVRDLPPAQKQAWKGLLDHYVFNNSSETVAHIPEHARGSIGAMSDTLARKLKAKILARFNR